MKTNYVIETKHLTKQFGSQKSVTDLNIHVKKGRIYGLLGRNGAGKTTTMKLIFLCRMITICGCIIWIFLWEKSLQPL